MKILAAYLSHSRPLIGVDLTSCFGGGLPVLMAGDLNDKHVDRNSQLTTRRGTLLPEFADGNFCLIYGLDTPTTNPYNPSTTPEVLYIIVTMEVPFQVYLTSCSALSSDHLPVLISTACRSSFHHPPNRPNFRRTDWENFQDHLEDHIPFDPELHNGMAIDECVAIFSDVVLQALQHLLPNVAHVTTNGLQYRLEFRTKYA